jgi:hypothetical protein
MVYPLHQDTLQQTSNKQLIKKKIIISAMQLQIIQRLILACASKAKNQTKQKVGTRKWKQDKKVSMANTQ